MAEGLELVMVSGMEKRSGIWDLLQRGAVYQPPKVSQEDIDHALELAPQVARNVGEGFLREQESAWRPYAGIGKGILDTLGRFSRGWDRFWSPTTMGMPGLAEMQRLAERTRYRPSSTEASYQQLMPVAPVLPNTPAPQIRMEEAREPVRPPPTAAPQVESVYQSPTLTPQASSEGIKEGSMNFGAYGISDEAAKAFVERVASMTKTAAPQIYLRRPMEARRELPKEVPPNCPSEEKEYTVGAINKMLEKRAEEGDPSRFKVTVRTGREAVGHLPRPPEQDERHFDVPTVQGAIEKLLLREGRIEKKATIGASEQIAGGMAGQGGGDGSPFGPAGSTVNYVSRGLMGAGLGRTLGFMMRGRVIPELVERRLGLGGAAIGLGLAGLAHRESTKAQSRRAALLQALAKFDSDRKMLQQQSKDLKKAITEQYRPGAS